MIDILMATYNGAAYVREQIESILSQTSSDWHLIICDDGSKDDTYLILQNYADRYPEKIDVYENAVNSGSAGSNFMGMLSHVTNDYVMFCDQDDLWHKEKVRKTYLAMRRMERTYGAHTPILVHGDLRVVDAAGEEIAPSLFALQKLSGNERSFAHQLVQNCVTGCTMMINKALYELVKEKPAQNMIMHDWWIALAASCFGKIGFIRTPMIDYRQHGNNEEGAKDYSGVTSTIRLAQNKEGIQESLRKTYAQAEAFDLMFGERMGQKERDILAAYESMAWASGLERLRLMKQYGFWKSGMNRRAGQIVYAFRG